MSKLRYQSEALWARLPMADFRPRFFVESYIEKLRLYTPHFYQSRLMNIFSACSEMLEHIEAYQSNEKNGGYVISTMEEIIECWDSDIVAQEVVGELVLLRSDFSKKVRSGEIDSYTQTRTLALCRAIISRKEVYLTALIERLENAILEPIDLAHKDRVASLIDELTGLYTTYLLNHGYSPTYLYNRAELLSRENNYNGRNFAAQFKLFNERLRNQRSVFEVYYGLYAAHPQNLLSINDEADLKFFDRAPAEINEANLRKLRKNLSMNVVAQLSISATDYVTAAFRTKERLDRLLDTETALEFRNDLRISGHCVTIYRGNNIHVRPVNVDMLLEFISSEGGSSVSHASIPMRSIFKSLDGNAKEQLGRSLRYLRLAKRSVSLEQKLLNTWIALESIFGNAGGNIIGNILEFVPQFYAVAGIGRRVAYLRELLVANEVLTTPLIQAEICPGMVKFDASLTDSDVFALLRNEKAAIELFNGLEGVEHLKFKLLKIFHEIKTNKLISARLNRSEADVSRQLRRIYFLRNKIAHTGHFEGVRPQLVIHLLDYLAISYRAISVATSKAEVGALYSIPELLTASRMGVDLVRARLASKDEVSLLEQLTLQPVI